MTMYYDLYGSREMDIHELQRAVANAIEVSFTRRNNLAYDDYYKADLPDPKSIRVVRNLLSDYGEEEVMEPAFEDRPVLLFVDGFEFAAELEKALMRIPGLELLRRKARPD